MSRLTRADGAVSERAGVRRAATLERYADSLRASGVPVCEGAAGTCWASSVERVVRRLPTFHTDPPNPDEVDRALMLTRGLLATYVVEPSEDHPANAWLYLCDDREYALVRRAPAMQRNVRRALRELTMSWLSPAEVLAHGATAFCDTRRRNHLDDGTAAAFRRYFEHREDRPGRSYLGAWKDGRLAAFVTVIHVDDWVELGSFSMSSMLHYRPNDALMYVALSRYLTEEGCRLVSYGLSSIQARTNAAGLHRFKTKVGFEPIPVHRAFVLHPSIRPYVNRATLTAGYTLVTGALSVRPGNRRLRKLGGMLACMLGGRAVAPADAGTSRAAEPESEVDAALAVHGSGHRT